MPPENNEHTCCERYSKRNPISVQDHSDLISITYSIALDSDHIHDMVGVDRLLPPELERQIFETAAVLFPETIANLLLVAARVLEW